MFPFFSPHRTIWATNNHFASSQNNFWKEGRFACLDSYGNKNRSGATSSAYSSDEDKKEKMTPFEEHHLQLRKKVMALIPNTLLSSLEAISNDPEAMEEFINENRDQILVTVSYATAQDKDITKKLRQMIDGKSAPPEKIRLMIEEALTPKKESEDERSLKKELEQKMIPEKNETQEKKRSRWQKILEMAAMMTHPLYRRLSSFLLNSAVNSIGVASPESIFTRLGKHEERMPLFRELADTRHSLVVEDAMDVDDRFRALEDLRAILWHGQYLLNEAERAEFYELYSRILGAITVVQDEQTRIHAGEKINIDDEDTQLALTDSENIRTFLHGEKDRDRVISGEKGLRKRLSEKGVNAPTQSNAYTTIANGLKEGGWFDSLPGSEGLKYTCSMIALEEVALLLNDVAYHRAGPRDIGVFIKNTVINVMRKGIRGWNGKSLAAEEIRDESMERTEQSFMHLYTKMEYRESHDGMHLHADLMEVDLLYVWLKKGDPNGFDPDGIWKKKIEAWQKESESTAEELREEADQKREELENALKDYAPLEVKVLRDADLKTLLAALTEVTEEQKLEWNLQKMAASPYHDAKAEWKMNRDRAFLRQEFDGDFVKRQTIEMEKGGIDDPVAFQDRAVNKSLIYEYDQNSALRTILHRAYVEGASTRILDVIEAEIHAESAKLLEDFSENLMIQMQERLHGLGREEEIDVTKLADIIERMAWHELPRVLWPDEMDTVCALGTLKHCSFVESTTPLEDAETYVRQLEFLRPFVEQAEKRRTQENAVAERCVEDAKIIVDNPETPEEARKMIGEIAGGDVRISALRPQSKEGIAQFAEHPRILTRTVEATNEYRKKSVTPSSMRADPALRGSIEMRIEGRHFELQKQLTTLCSKAEKTLKNFDLNIANRAVQEFVKGGSLNETLKRKLLTAQTAPKQHAEKILHEVAGTLKRVEVFIENLDKAKGSEPEQLGEGKWEARAEEMGIPAYAWGGYHRGEKKIFLNKQKIEEYKEEYKTDGEKFLKAIRVEEDAHAVINELLQIFPNFLNTYKQYAFSKSSKADEFAFHMEAKGWGIDQKSMSADAYDEEAIEEFIAKGEVYDKYRDDIPDSGYAPAHLLHLNHGTIELFRRTEEVMKEEMPEILEFSVAAERKERARKGAAASGSGSGGGSGSSGGSSGADDEDEDEDEYEKKKKPKQLKIPAPEVEFEGPEYEPGKGLDENTSKIERHIIKIDSFLEHTPEQRTETNARFVSDVKNEYQELKKIILETESPEKDKSILDTVDFIESTLEERVIKIDEWDSHRQEVALNPPVKMNIFRKAWEEIELMSVDDFIAIYKSIEEDIKREHGRRQQGKIGRVGTSLTEWITSNKLMQKIPYINNLAADFQRRDKNAESEGVENWKKSLTEMDSYEIQEMLGSPANPDHLKAMLMLLSERGRLDWTNEDLWKSLSRFSGIKIPEGECIRNENILDDYLRTLCSKIWDQDFYNNTKTGNTSAIKSEKSKYSTEAERLCNTKKDSDELARQLRLYTLAKEDGKPIPKTVNPHRYEEILDYTIRAGKMNVEKKMYFLVQGIASGLLGIDRLSYITGEGSGFLAQFPFLDYFDGHNNTMSELKRLAFRLRESNDINDEWRYKPGLKTTLWIMMEVSRDPGVRIRISKGMSKAADNTDHDDFHMILPYLDADHIDKMMTPQGGGRDRISPDGWANGYVGFNSFFKTHAMIAKMENEGWYDGKFTSDDADDIARAMSSYVRMDGLLSKRTSGSDNRARRAHMDMSNMERKKAIARGGKNTVYDDRKVLTSFVLDVIKEYGLDKEKNRFAEIMLHNVEDGQTYLHDEEVTALSTEFEPALRKAFKKGGLHKLKKILMKHEGGFSGHATGGKRGETGKYNYENVKALERQRIQSSQLAAAE